MGTEGGGSGRRSRRCEARSVRAVRDDQRPEEQLTVCGIAGVAGHNGTPVIADATAAALAHRGPDSTGTADASGTSGGWTFTHARLAIVDLSSAGNQPMENEDGSLVLAYNGEIYNSPELRRLCEAHGHRFRSQSDGEVILHLWEMEGAACFERLNGIFAIALGDRATGEVVLCRDPVGVKPLFYAVDEETLWFASELRALAAAGAPTGDPDLVALAQFLTFLWVPDPRTPYRHARSLPPGHLLRFAPGQVVLTRFSDLVGEAAAAGDIQTGDVVTEARRLIADAVQRQLLADVPVGLMASGGIDSSLVWWGAADNLMTAFTIDWSCDSGQEGLSEDTDAVRVLEEALHTPVSYLPGDVSDRTLLPPSGDLFADPAYELTRTIARAARDAGIKVLLSGQGGDEVFAGYRRHLVAPLLERARFGAASRAVSATLARVGHQNVRLEYLSRLARAVSHGDVLGAYMELCSYSTASDRAHALDCTEAEVSDAVVWESHQSAYDLFPPEWSALRRVRALDLSVYLPGLGLAYVDRSSMEHGVEVRVPLLDLELVRWALRLPDHLLVRGRTSKHVPREVARLTLPALIADRKKRGFGVPVSMVDRGSATRGSRGFRQGSYFALACDVLNRHLATPLASRAVGAVRQETRS